MPEEIDDPLWKIVRKVNQQQLEIGTIREAPTVEIKVFSDIEMRVLTYLLPQHPKGFIDVVSAVKIDRSVISCCLQALTDRGVLVCHVQVSVGNFVGRRMMKLYTLVSTRVKIGDKEYDLAKGER